MRPADTAAQRAAAHRQEMRERKLRREERARRGAVRHEWRKAAEARDDAMAAVWRRVLTTLRPA